LEKTMDNAAAWIYFYMNKPIPRKHQSPSRLLSLGDSRAIYIDIFRHPDADVAAVDLGLQRPNLPA
jgi:hypothetical protein